MIKYRVKGNFLSEDGDIQNICSDFFKNTFNPFDARKQVRNYLNNFINLLLIDFKIDFQSTFQKKSEIEIEDKKFEYILKYGIAIEFTLDELEFYEIDYYGMFDNNLYDCVAEGLKAEFEYYKKNNFGFENSQTITYCNKGEWMEGYTEDEPTTFEILETSFDFSNKENPYWWNTIEEKKELVRNYIEEKQIEKAFQYGENNLVEFKPSLLYNFNPLGVIICSKID